MLVSLTILLSDTVLFVVFEGYDLKFSRFALEQYVRLTHYSIARCGGRGVEMNTQQIRELFQIRTPNHRSLNIITIGF